MNVVSCLVIFTSDRIPSSQMEPELLHTIAQIKPLGTGWCGSRFLPLKQRGLSDRDLERQWDCQPNPKHMTADDVGKLAAFAYHSHPDFQDVLAEQPAIMKVQ